MDQERWTTIFAPAGTAMLSAFNAAAGSAISFGLEAGSRQAFAMILAHAETRVCNTTKR